MNQGDEALAAAGAELGLGLIGLLAPVRSSVSSGTWCGVSTTALARRASAPAGNVALPDVAELLDARVRITTGVERARFVIDVPSAEANRILGLLGAPAVV